MRQCLLFVIFSYYYYYHIRKVWADCSISINNDLTEPQPLILRPEGGNGNDAFYLPTSGDAIMLFENQLVDLACPNSQLLLNGDSIDSETGQARCISGRFSIEGLTLAFSGITCSVIPYHTAQFTGNTCEYQYQEIEIGFRVGDRFLRQILVCFDHTFQTTLYSRYSLTKAIAGYQSGYPRPNWLEGSQFYDVGNITVNTLYSRNKQRATINALLGLDASSYKYIERASEFYLTRGHLAAKADFVFGSQHRSTFYFVNAAPQWQTFNGQNWNYLEQDVRDFASRSGLDLVIYTGTYGVATLPHELTDEEIELYLYVDGDTRAIPVPRLFWKLLYEPVTKAGVIFIGVNNPYFLNIDEDIICPDICSEYPWLTWKASDVTLGYSYCCSVSDARKAFGLRNVPTFPNFEVDKLLK